MTETTVRRVIIIGGPNGAGKSTFAQEFLPNEAECPVFVNADLIAAGLSPFAPGSCTTPISLWPVPVCASLKEGNVTEEVIRRRFAVGWANFQNVYRDVVDSWQLYDNSGERALISQGTKR